MKTKWLNLVLILTNRIYSKKQSLVGEPGIKVIIKVFGLIFWEIVLALVSFPLYLSLKSSNVVAFLEEKGGYKKISFDYNLRRILTLTGASIILLIWVLKLILILAVPNVFGPLKLYNIANLQSADITIADLINTETAIQTAKIVSSIPTPELKKAERLTGGDYNFSGVGVPNSEIILLLSDIHTVVYSEKIDSSGNWKIQHLHTKFNLREGVHSVLLFNFNRENGTRSNFAPEQYFRVTSTWLDKLTNNVDSLANWSVVLIIAIGIFLTLLTI